MKVIITILLAIFMYLRFLRKKIVKYDFEDVVTNHAVLGKDVQPKIVNVT